MVASRTSASVSPREVGLLTVHAVATTDTPQAASSWTAKPPTPPVVPDTGMDSLAAGARGGYPAQRYKRDRRPPACSPDSPPGTRATRWQRRRGTVLCAASYGSRMGFSGPWWGTPVVTFGGVLLTLLVTMWIDRRKAARESRYRWAAEKMALYSELLDACDDLGEIEVWPVGRGAEPAGTRASYVRIRRIVRRGYPAPSPVRARMAAVLSAAAELVTMIDEVRAGSKPGHQGALDDRMRSRFDVARADFDMQVEEFLAASRADIDVEHPRGRDGPMA